MNTPSFSGHESFLGKAGESHVTAMALACRMEVLTPMVDHGHGCDLLIKVGQHLIPIQVKTMSCSDRGNWTMPIKNRAQKELSIGKGLYLAVLCSQDQPGVPFSFLKVFAIDARALDIMAQKPKAQSLHITSRSRLLSHEHDRFAAKNGDVALIEASSPSEFARAIKRHEIVMRGDRDRT